MVDAKQCSRCQDNMAVLHSKLFLNTLNMGTHTAFQKYPWHLILLLFFYIDLFIWKILLHLSICQYQKLSRKQLQALSAVLKFFSSQFIFFLLVVLISHQQITAICLWGRLNLQMLDYRFNSLAGARPLSSVSQYSQAGARPRLHRTRSRPCVAERETPDKMTYCCQQYN